ncbi:MAG: oligosaccharide flippase family protein [Thiogranum sp.]
MLVSLFAAPIIGRLFTPSDYGVAALFLTIAMLLGSTAPLNYERAALLPKNGENMSLLLVLSLRLLIAVAFFVLLSEVALWALSIQIPFGESLGIWVWVIPVGILVVGARNILVVLLTRQKKFRTIAYTQFWQSVITTGSRITAGALWGSSIFSLIAGFLLGFCTYLMLLKGQLRNVINFLSAPRSWANLKSVALEYRDFPIYSMPAVFATRLSAKIPILALGAIFAPEITGFYAMADRLIQAPLMAGGEAVRKVYLQRTADMVNCGTSLRGPFIKTTGGLLLLGVIPFGFLGFYGSEFLELLLGERWATAGTYVEILVPWYYAAWVGLVSQSTMTVLRKQALWFWLQIAVLVVRVAVFTALAMTGAAPTTLLGVFSAANVLLACIIWLIAYRLIWNMKNE